MPKDFFKRHDVRILEGMRDGKEMLLLYMKLLCESLDHEGSLRYSDKMPYTNEMLASVTNTQVDIVQKALKTLSDLGLCEILDDGTVFMTKVSEMTGSETHAAKYMRERRHDEVVLGEFDNVSLSKSEIEKLKEFYPSHWAKYVEKLSAYKKSTGTTYESDYATLKQWMMKDIGEIE